MAYRFLTTEHEGETNVKVVAPKGTPVGTFTVPTAQAADLFTTLGKIAVLEGYKVTFDPALQDTTPGEMLQRVMSRPAHQQIPGYSPPPEEYDSAAIRAASERLLPASMDVATRVIDRFATTFNPGVVGDGAMRITPGPRGEPIVQPHDVPPLVRDESMQSN